MQPDQHWPPLPYEAWEPTKETVHRYAQMIGKVRMALVPPRNHWWHVTLLLSARGLTTGPMTYRGRHVEIALDLLDHRMHVLSSDGRSEAHDMTGRSVRELYRDLFAALRAVDVEVEIRAVPYKLGDAIPFDEDAVHDAYDPDAVTRFWRVLAATERVLAEFRGSFNGKASPVHLFWHSLDLAHARYSGRPAPVAPGTGPVDAEAYSHEVIAFGFWPGDRARTPFPAFYSYTAPEPSGLSRQPLEPAQAAWHDTGSGSLAVLPYDAVREAADPAGALLSFYESAYQAGARTGAWDVEQFARVGRAGLEPASDGL
jgi:Family of unknown function (DUF5996)